MKTIVLSIIILISAGFVSGAIIYTNKNKPELNNTNVNNTPIVSNSNESKDAEEKAQKIETIKNKIAVAKANADNYKKSVDSISVQINEVNKRPAECQKLPVSLYYSCYSSYQTEFNRLTGLSQGFQDKEQEYVSELVQLNIELRSLSK